MPIPTQAQYEQNELRRALNQERLVDSAPLADRKEGQANYLNAMVNDPAGFAEKLSWLIDGNYGHGEMQRAKQIVASPRMNRVAALSTLLAVYEYQCPARMAADAWKKLTKTQQTTINRAIDVVIRAAEKEE